MSGGDSKSCIEFLKNMGKLKHLKRTGWVQNKIPEPETVSGHMYRMAMAAMMLDQSDNVDTDRVLRMCLVHDAAECIVGDLTPHCRVSDEDKHCRELNAMKNLASLTPIRMCDDMTSLFEEYEAQETTESHMVKDLDRFDMILQAFEYEVATCKPASLEQFFKGTENKFKHPRIKNWVDELYKQRKELINTNNKGSEITTKSKRSIDEV